MYRLPPAPPAAEREQLRPRLIRHFLPFIDLAEQGGADLDGLLAQVGLSRSTLRQSKAQLPYYQLHWLVEQLIAQCGDPEIGLRAAERVSFVRTDYLGDLIKYLVHSSTDLLTVLQLLGHFGTYVAGTLHTTCTVDDAIVTFAIVPVVPGLPEAADCMAGACCALIEALGGTGLRPLEIRLPPPKGPPEGTHWAPYRWWT